MKEESETSCKRGMEVIGIPRNPVVPICNVGIGVVPGPVQEVHRNDVVGYV